MIRDPFKRHTVILHLTEYSLQMIIQLIASSNPSQSDEELIVQLHTELNEILTKIRNE